MIGFVLRRLLKTIKFGEMLRGFGTVFSRQPLAILASLISSWTALAVALWLAVVFALVGLVLGFIVGDIVGSVEAHHSFALLGALGGLVGGFLIGFGLIFGLSIAQGLVHILITVSVGGLLAVVITGFCVRFESTALDWRGYRRTSRRTEEGKLPEMLRQVALRMGLQRMPRLRIKDDPVPGAWAHMGCVVLTKGLVTQMSDEEVSAVMAHELHHWAQRDTVAARSVWACCLPLVVMTNLYYLATAGLRRVFFGSFLARMLLWPAPVLLRFLVVPTLLARGRRLEYEADAAAIAAGFGPSLGAALSKLSDFEVARTGWEQALLRTHPPVEFRLEAIEEAAAPPRPRRISTASEKAKATNGPIRIAPRPTRSAAARS